MRPYILRLPDWLGQIPEWVPLLGGAQVGGRPIFSYGVMLGFSFLLGWLLSAYCVEKMGYDKKKTGTIFLSVPFGAILGARLLYFIASAPEEFSVGAFFRFQDGGLVAYGGFLGGILASAATARFLKADWWGRSDAVAPTMALGVGVTRFGCFLYGCDFGKQTDAAWALRFPRWSTPAIAEWIPSGSPAFSQHFRGHFERSPDMLSMGVHPTQLLMSLNGFVCFFILMVMLARRKFAGQVMLGFLLYYSVTRFLVEFLRGDKIRGTTTLGLPFSTS